MLRKIAIAAASLLLFSCANQANQYLIDDVQINGDASISILTIEHDYLFDQFPDHVFGALRPAERSIFDQQLAGLLSSKTNARVEGKLNTYILLDHDFEIREFSLSNDSMKMLSPKAGSELNNGELNTRFVILLDQFHFTHYQIEVGGDTYAGHENETEDRLRFEAKYLIWDNEAGDAIAWGRLNTNQRLRLQNQSLTYTELISNAFTRLIEASPFPRTSG